LLRREEDIERTHSDLVIEVKEWSRGVGGDEAEGGRGNMGQEASKRIEFGFSTQRHGRTPKKDARLHEKGKAQQLGREQKNLKRAVG